MAVIRAEQGFFIVNNKLVLILTVTKNRLCPETDSSVLVTFGARAVSGVDCEGQLNSTEIIISSGDSVTFYLDAAIIPSDATICFIVSLDGMSGKLINDIM